jgi:outer membrane lipoprotein-sorting protein
MKVNSVTMQLAAAVLLAACAGAVRAQQPTADYIMQRVDDNQTADSRIITSRMIIHGRRGSRTITSKSWIEGDDKSFTEYLAPARERGTKMLKLGDQLWTYTPSTDRIVLISGHLLRHSVMGSDLSYEDMMEDPLLQNVYDAQITGEETLMDRPVWVLDLQAKKEDASYDRCKIWVDKERYISLKENLYAKSGKLLKTIQIQEVMAVDDRWVPKKALYKDVLKQGEGTQLMVDSIEFNKDLPPHIFSKASLRR